LSFIVQICLSFIVQICLLFIIQMGHYKKTRTLLLLRN
jgi:hypothetical protein